MFVSSNLELYDVDATSNLSKLASTSESPPDKNSLATLVYNNPNASVTYFLQS